MRSAEAARAELVERLWAPSRAATVRRCADLYERTSAKLFGICLRILRDREEAEDVLQDMYLTIWNRAESFDPAVRARSPGWRRSRATGRSTGCGRSGGAAPTQPVEEAGDLADDRPDGLAR